MHLPVGLGRAFVPGLFLFGHLYLWLPRGCGHPQGFSEPEKTRGFLGGGGALVGIGSSHCKYGGTDMTFSLATWNINSVRLREPIVLKLLAEHGPDVLCLQECKSPVDKIPREAFNAAGYTHMVARGDKGYNGVAILSRLPIEEVGAEDFAELGHARHVSARLENGVTVHNFYVPAGGDEPNRERNVKFGQKLYSWWSYRAKDWDAADKGRRLDHIWATSDIAQAGHSSHVLRAARGWEKPSDHAPVFATFDL